ncbi:MAG: response regulator transcription factor [Bdellovibrionales bacterium]|nr:response regulator transcription factor [Oligoflexia bacterium]
MKSNILIVEDDEAIRESLIELLETEGYCVKAAENGQVALDYLITSQNHPNLILLDLMMPVMGGLEFCIEMEKNKKLSQIPIVIMSADGRLQEKQNLSRAMGFIRKPVDIDDILATVKKYCQ